MTAGLESPTLLTTSEVITSPEEIAISEQSQPSTAAAAHRKFWLRALVLLTLSGGMGALMAVVGKMVNG